MILEHLIYSTAIAIISGMIYSKLTSRDHSWIVIASAYTPDVDVVADSLLRKIGIVVLINGNPIEHGDFHNMAALLIYAVLVALLLHPLGIRLVDSFVFASIGFAAHLVEDALVFNPGYAFFWPLLSQKYGIGIIGYHKDFYGIADKYVLCIGLVAVVVCAAIRTACEGKGWVKTFLHRTQPA